MSIKNMLLKAVEKKIAERARKSAGREANSACALFSYQPKEPIEVKKLRRF